jgi:hypothetical protein
MEEMMEDVLEMDEDEELEEEADGEVDKILFELTDGKLGMAGSVSAELPVCLNDYVPSCLSLMLYHFRRPMNVSQTRGLVRAFKTENIV